MQVLWEGLERFITYRSLRISFKHARLQMVWRCGAKCCADAVPNSPLSELLAIKTNGTDVGAKKHHYQCLTVHEAQ